MCVFSNTFKKEDKSPYFSKVFVEGESQFTGRKKSGNVEVALAHC